MSWKKNAFSYVCWFLYAVLTGTALLCLAGYTCEVMRLELYWAFIFGVLYVLCAAVVVILLHRISIEVSAYMGGRRILEGLSKAVLLAVPATVGLYLRLRLIDGLGTVSNELATIIIVALVIQMAVAFLLFFILNKLSGFFCGLVSFGFMMCSSGIVQRLDDNTIEMLSLLILLLVFGMIVLGYKKKLYPALYIFYGALAAFVARLDVCGILLLCMIFAFVFVEREFGAGVGRKIAAIICAILGFAGGLCGTLAVESLLIQKSFAALFFEWVRGYSAEKFQLPVSIEIGDVFTEACVLIGLMVLGIFSFWYDRNREQIAFGTLLLYGMIALNCFGIDGRFLQGTFMIHLLMVVMAGVSVQQCISGICVSRNILVPEESIMEISKENPADNVEDCAREITEEFMQQETPVELRKIQFIENPLPLPKKHEKRVLAFDIQVVEETSDYDVEVAENDDYDI